MRGTARRGECCCNRSEEKVGAVGTAPGAAGHLCRPARGTGGADGHPLPRGTRHIFDTAHLPNGCFHSSGKGRGGRENSRPSNTWEKSHTPHRKGKNWENFNAGLPATHRKHTHSSQKPPKTSVSWHRSLPQGEDTGRGKWLSALLDVGTGRTIASYLWRTGSERDSERLRGRISLDDNLRPVTLSIRKGWVS